VAQWSGNPADGPHGQNQQHRGEGDEDAGIDALE